MKRKNIVTIDGVQYKIVTPVIWDKLDTMGRSVAVIEGRTTFLKEIKLENKSMTRKQINDRLEYLRKQINDECISYGEIAELQSLAKHIAPDDVQLLEWAGVSEK